MASLTLVRAGVTTVEAADLGIFRLVVSVEDVVGIDENIFVFKAEATPASPPGDLTHKFTNVASIADMADYPVDAPSEDNEYPFFRSDSVTLDFRSTADLEYGWDEIRNRVQSLLTATTRLDDLLVQEEAELEG